MWDCYASRVRNIELFWPRLSAFFLDLACGIRFTPTRKTGSLKREEKDGMGDSSIVDSGLFRVKESVRHLSWIALALAVVMILPAARVAAQEASTAPTAEAEVQFVRPSGAAQTTPPLTITFQDALERARKLDPTFIGAASDARNAREDRLQSRNSMLPTLTGTSQYLNTQGNGITPDGRYVTNDGIHVYRDWLILHQDLSPGVLMGTAFTRAKAAEAMANAKSEIARRGLAVAVTKAYYALVAAQRKYAAAQAALDQAKHFMDIANDLEHQGQGAHSDSVKAEVQYRIQKQAFDESRFSMEDTRLSLAVILFPDFNENFTVVDDLDSAPALPSFPEVQAMAEKQNPDMRVALETAHEAELDVKLAKTAFLPTLTIDADEGIEANCFGLHCTQAAFDPLKTGVGQVPSLGYFLTVTLNVPIWDWGSLRSKLHQAEYKQDAAKAQLSLAQRTAISELYATYDEAMVARGGLEEARRTAELAQESMRLVNLRYEGGASPAADMADAQTTLVTAQNAFADAQVRYRTLLATLQTFTGKF
jgi:outer membrane protein